MRHARVVTALLVLLAFLPGSASAQAEVIFGEPVATGAFGGPLRFATAFQSAETPLRVELLSSVPGDDELRVTIAAVEPNGPGRWQATAFQVGHIVPNTTFEFRFRVVTASGSATGPAGRHRVDDERFEWQILEGDRVNVWWNEGGPDFAQRALDIAEAAMEEAATLLGVEVVEPVDFII
ncbi:MAG: hypothetical protein ACC726_09005, partial [Chloroflexota bacterium]